MKKVSVIVPVYNSQDYLRECVDSLVGQTLEDIEIIFVNDGSTDDSLRILEEYEKKYPQKIVIYSKENGGQATARNLGIHIATGEYIGFVDSDDYVDVEMFEKLYNAAKSNESDFAECMYKYLQVEEDGAKKEIPPYGNVRAYKDKSEMFIDPLVSPWNKIYRADILKENQITFPEGVIYEDTAFFIKSIPFLNKTAHVEDALVYHFLRENSTMNAKKDIRVGNIFTVLEDIIQFYEKSNFKDTYRKELEYFCVKILLCSSLGRVARVGDKALRSELVRKTMDMIQTYFQEYRKNNYLKNGATGMYMKCINGVSVHLVVAMLRVKSGL